MRIDPNQAHNFCYTVGNLVVINFRLTFGWTDSPGNFGVMASAAEHAHCNTDLSNVQLLPEGVKMMKHVEIVDRWEVGDPTPVLSDAKMYASKGGKLSSPFYTVAYVDDHGFIRAQQSDEDKSALVVSASLASDYVRLFGPGEPGETPILAPKKSSNWNTTLDFLGFVINLHMLEISVTTKKAQVIKAALVDDWPRYRRRTTAQEVFSIADKLWNLTYVIRAGKHFVWRLLRLTDLHTRTGKKQSHSVELGREFHDDLDFWRWAIDHELLTAGESLSAPCFAAIKRPAKRYYLSGASFDAIGGFCRKLRICWSYNLPIALSAELKRKAARRETCRFTINLLELVGMVLTAWVMHELVRDRPESKRDPILMRGDNFAAVTWANRCGGARDKRAGLMMRMLGRLEIQGGWRYDAKYIPGVQNTLADGISRWPRSELADRVRQLTNTDEWSEQSIGARGERLCEIVMQTRKHCSSSQQYIVGDNDSFWLTLCPCSDSALARIIFKLSSSQPLPLGLSGTGDGRGGMSAEVALLVESLVRASVGGSTHKVYLGKWNKWLEFVKKKGRGPWLNLLDKSGVLTLLLEFMACRLFSFNNQHSTVRGYLAAIKFFHKLYLGWELTTSHCMIAAAGKGIGRFREISGKNAQVRLPLTWSILAHGYLTVTSSQDGGDVMWLGLALSYFLLCRASELFVYANGLVHPHLCLTRDCLAFSCGNVQVNIEDRARADSVKVLFVASKTDQNRESCTTTRVRMAEGAVVGKTPVGAFEALVELLDAHPRLPGGAPLMTRRTASGVWVESDNSDRSSRCVENDGSKRRQEPRSVCVALGADRGSHQASRAGNVRVANPAGGPVEVSGVYGLCERCGRRRTKGVRGPYKGRISIWR